MRKKCQNIEAVSGELPLSGFWSPPKNVKFWQELRTWIRNILAKFRIFPSTGCEMSQLFRFIPYKRTIVRRGGKESNYPFRLFPFSQSMTFKSKANNSKQTNLAFNVAYLQLHVPSMIPSKTMSNPTRLSWLVSADYSTLVPVLSYVDSIDEQLAALHGGSDSEIE